MYIVYVLRPNYWNGKYFNVYSLPAFSSIVDFGFLFFKEKEEEVQIEINATNSIDSTCTEPGIFL